MSHRSTPPSYRLHKPSGKAVVTLPDGRGGRKDVYLGLHGSPESRREYERIVIEWESLMLVTARSFTILAAKSLPGQHRSKAASPLRDRRYFSGFVFFDFVMNTAFATRVCWNEQR
jgi:hypothetical protein